MREEALDELRSPTDPDELMLDAVEKLIDIAGHAVSHPLFGIAMTVLLRIEFGTVGRQELKFDLRVGLNELAHILGAMRCQPIPDDDHRPLEIAPQSLQAAHQPWCVDRLFEVDRIDPATRCQRAEATQATPFVLASEDRSESRLSPRRGRSIAKADAELVSENDVCATRQCFFLSGANPEQAMLRPERRPLPERPLSVVVR